MIPLDLSPKSILLTAEDVPRLTSFVEIDAVIRFPLGFSAFMAPEEVESIGMVPGDPDAGHAGLQSGRRDVRGLDRPTSVLTR